MSLKGRGKERQGVVEGSCQWGSEGFLGEQNGCVFCRERWGGAAVSDVVG